MNAPTMTPPTRTPLPPEQAFYALALAHQSVIGQPISRNRLACLAAHSAFETDAWHAMWCFNFGNIRGRASDGHWTSIKGASEIIDGKEVFFDIGPQNMFAAYPDALKGAEAYARFLGVATSPPKPNRYAIAWDAADALDVLVFCRELQAHGYFTAGLQHYTSGMRTKLEWLQPALRRFWQPTA